jgi:lupus La protein
MRKLSGGADNDPVQIATLHSFKRMRRFQPAGAVVAALRESETLEVVDAKGNPAPEPVEGEEDKEVGFVAEAYVRRRVAWVDPKANAAADDNDGDTAAALEDPGLPRSIYAKGFGTETATTQFDVEAYFAPFGPVNMVRLRRKMPDRTFKGSAFVEFATEELAKAFLESDSRPRWAGETALKVMTKREYLEKQEEDIKAGKIAEDKKTKYKLYSSGGKRGERHEGGRGRDGKHDGGGRRGGHEDRNGRGDRNGRDRRGGRDGRDARDRRGGRDDRNGRDEDDWRGRRDDFQKKLKDDDGEAGYVDLFPHCALGFTADMSLFSSADGKPAGGDAKPATSPAPPSPGKRARDEGADDGEDAGAKRAKVERAAEAVEGGNVG